MPSVVTNFKNLKKMFQKKRSTSEEHTYAEIAEESHRSGNAEHEYQELPGGQNINGDPFSCTGTAGGLTDSGLPYEYLSPPPFAPGY